MAGDRIWWYRWYVKQEANGQNHPNLSHTLFEYVNMLNHGMSNNVKFDLWNRHITSLYNSHIPTHVQTRFHSKVVPTTCFYLDTFLNKQKLIDCENYHHELCASSKTVKRRDFLGPRRGGGVRKRRSPGPTSHTVKLMFLYSTLSTLKPAGLLLDCLG